MKGILIKLQSVLLGEHSATIPPDNHPHNIDSRSTHTSAPKHQPRNTIPSLRPPRLRRINRTSRSTSLALPLPSSH